MSFLDILKSFIPLLLILGLLFGVLILVRKFSFTMNGKKSQMFKLDVISNQLILPKKYLSVVRVRDKVLILGISENNITLLKELEYCDMEEDVNIEQKDLKKNFVDAFKRNLGIR